MDVGIFAIVENEEKDILLVKDATRQELWTLPGGGLDFKEIATDAVAREVFEETSLVVRAEKFIGCFSQKVTPGIVLLFTALVLEGVPKADGIETQQVGYFSFQEMMDMGNAIKPAQLSMVHQYLQREESEVPIFNHFTPPSVE